MSLDLDAGNAETEDLVTDLRKLTGRQAVIRMSYWILHSSQGDSQPVIEISTAYI